MQLECLCLDDLEDLLTKVMTLRNVSTMLTNHGMVPTFSLRPDQPVFITVPVFLHLGAVPETPSERTNREPVETAARKAQQEVRVGAPGAAQAETDEDGRDRRERAAPLGPFDEFAEAAHFAPLLAAFDPTPAAEQTGDLLPAGAADPVAAELDPSGPAATAQLTDKAVQLAEPTASGILSMQPPRWTEAEDATAVQMAVAMGAMYFPSTAAPAIAAALNRPASGVEYRLRNKLAQPIAQARLDARAQKPEPEPVAAAPDRGQSEAVSDSSAGGVSEPPPPARPDPQPASPIRQHLMTLPRKGLRTLGDDLELMTLSCDGFPPNAIADELRTDAAEVKRRFDQLTDLHRNAEDKPVRRYTREEVREALKQLALDQIEAPLNKIAV